VLPPTIPFPYKETVEQDYFGQLNNPYGTIGEYHYRRKMDVKVFCIVSATTGKAHLYAYTPRMGHQGPNQVINATFHMEVAHPSCARILNRHYDRCAGQSSNWACVKASDTFTDPKSPYFIYEKISESAAVTGHSYQAADRAVLRLFLLVRLAANSVCC
jgi:hypothetical protein